MAQPSVEKFDAIIIGAGQAGKPLALELAEDGWKTAIIERKYVGGTCINYGCTPTKTMIASAHAAHLARHAGELGVFAQEVQVDFKKVIGRKNQVVQEFRNGIEKSFEEAKNLTLIYGEARFTGHKILEVSVNKGNSRQLTAEKIVIDCGTSTHVPDITGLHSVQWLDSTSIMDVEEIPPHLLIIGGGYIAVEFGQMFRRFGSQVSIFEHSRQLLSHEDEDIAAELKSILEEEKIHIYLESAVQQINKSANGEIEIQVKIKDKIQTLKGSHLLIATGNTPNTAALHLQATAIQTDEKGYIQVNSKLETAEKGVYAVGDIKGGPAFTHISYDDYRVLKQNLLKDGNATITNRMLPYTVFTDPQLGRIGLNEKEAKEKGIRIKVAKLPMKSVARAIETGQTKGMMKALVDADTGQIVGASILGIEGGEIMSMIQIAMMGKLTYMQLRDAVTAHPTLAESLNVLFQKVE